MKNLSAFQIVVFVVCGAAAVGGVIAISVFSADSGEQYNVSVWGSMPEKHISRLKDRVGFDKQYPNMKMTYTRVPDERFDELFVEALANQEGPDMIMLPHDKILKHRNKLQIIPYTSYTREQFTSAFVPAAEIFMQPDGVIGLPFTIDPMVMYWNRQMFNNQNIPQPPQNWSDFETERMRSLVQKSNEQITQSMLAFGEYDNVPNAKSILTTLMQQAGSPIVSADARTGRVINYITRKSSGNTLSPTTAAVNYYTQFADRDKIVYTWNKSLPNARDAFLAGNLGVYFGFTSEYEDLTDRNPNLDIGVTKVPQRAPSEPQQNKATAANVRALAITKQTTNATGAFRLAQILTRAQTIEALAAELSLPPVRRDVLSSVKPDGVLESVAMDSVLWAKTWLDPNPSQTDDLFQNMVNEIQAGRFTLESAVSRTRDRMDRIIETVSN